MLELPQILRIVHAFIVDDPIFVDERVRFILVEFLVDSVLEKVLPSSK